MLFEHLRCGKEWSSDVERYKSAQLQTERLLEAREQSHRQQVLRLENQVHYYFLNVEINKLIYYLYT